MSSAFSRGQAPRDTEKTEPARPHATPDVCKGVSEVSPFPFSNWPRYTERVSGPLSCLRPSGCRPGRPERYSVFGSHFRIVVVERCHARTLTRRRSRSRSTAKTRSDARTVDVGERTRWGISGPRRRNIDDGGASDPRGWPTIRSRRAQTGEPGLSRGAIRAMPALLPTAKTTTVRSIGGSTHRDAVAWSAVGR